MGLPAPQRGHRSICPWSTRLAALPSKCLWGLRRGLISTAACSCLSAPPPHLGSHMVTCPNKWQPEVFPPPAAGTSELGGSAWQEKVLLGLLGRNAAGLQALAVAKAFQHSDPEPLNYSLALTKYREPGSSSHL